MKLNKTEVLKAALVQPKKVLTAEGYKRRFILPLLNKKSKKSKAAA